MPYTVHSIQSNSKVHANALPLSPALQIVANRLWMLRHVAMGYSVHMQRLLGYLSWWLFPIIVPGYTDLTQEGAQMRADVFGLCEFVLHFSFILVSLSVRTPTTVLIPGDQSFLS